MLPTGVAARKMAFEHSFELVDGQKVKSGKSSDKRKTAIKMERHPVMTIIQTYNEDADEFQE